MLRRLSPEQPESFAFTEANLDWAKGQIAKYPEGRQASAVIPLLWRAQEQEGWVSKPAIENVAELLGLAPIRVLEVASFYFMFQLQPVGSVAHVQVCGTTSCMICGAEDLIAVCRDKIASEPHEVSADGKFSWEEVECLGACANAPMAQIGKDYYEDLTADGFAEILDAFARGEVPRPGPQDGRFSSEPSGGLTSLTNGGERLEANASVTIALALDDTVKRISGDEKQPDAAVLKGTPVATADADPGGRAAPASEDVPSEAEQASKDAPADPVQQAARQAAPSYSAESEDERAVDVDPETAAENETAQPPRTAKSQRVSDAARAAGEAARMLGEPVAAPAGATAESARPEGLQSPREGGADDLKQIKGVGPKLEDVLNGLGYYHFDQIAAWTADEVAWVDDNLEGFKGRVSRDAWVDQAKTLASGGTTEFSERYNDDDES